MAKNDELSTKFELLESSEAPNSIRTQWRDRLVTTGNKLADLRAASDAYSNRQISADDFLTNFAPVRIELVALEALIDKSVS